MACSAFNLFKIKPRIDGKIQLYSCCQRDYSKRIEIDFDKFEKNIESRDFYDYINSFHSSVGCHFENECDHAQIKENTFLGIANSLYIPCNEQCYFCFARYLRNRISDEYLARYNNLYFKIIEKTLNSNFKTLRLTDHGEPTIGKRTIELLNNIPASSKIENIEIISNGIEIDKFLPIFEKNKNIKFIVNISLNAFDEESYEYITKTNNFQKAYNNLKLLADSNLENLDLFCSFVVTDYLSNYIDNLIEFFDKLPAKIQFRCGYNQEEVGYLPSQATKEMTEFLWKITREHNKKYC